MTMDTTKSDAPSENEPFGRQPQPVHVTFLGDLRDCETYIRKLTHVIENGSYATVSRMGNQIVIYPAAVND
jgi:hypothetical protein